MQYDRNRAYEDFKEVWEKYRKTEGFEYHVVQRMVKGKVKNAKQLSDGETAHILHLGDVEIRRFETIWYAFMRRLPVAFELTFCDSSSCNGYHIREQFIIPPEHYDNPEYAVENGLCTT